jgi:ribosomal-protein-alanine N-acetyltransferase
MRDAATLRTLSLHDLAFVRRLAREAFAEYDGEREAAAHTLALIARPGSVTLVAERSAQPVGFVSVHVRGPEASLLAIAVERARRGRGIGGLLLGAAERIARERHAITIRLETGEANVEAIELFVGAGYERDGRVRRYYRSGYDALRFRKALGSG